MISGKRIFCWLVGWLCLTSHRQRGHLETAPPFTVPYEGREAPNILYTSFLKHDIIVPQNFQNIRMTLN